MKKALHTTLKFLLVFAIFLGLQSRVLMRYAEIFHKNYKSETVHSGITKVKGGIVHCKLQCYTQHFQSLDAPFAALLLTLIIAALITHLFYISFKEKLHLTDSVWLLPLRGPPGF